MKKMIVILVMLLSGIVANGQNTVGAIRDGFKNGCFYITLDDDIDNRSTLMFQSVEDKVLDKDDNIVSAVFETMTETDNTERGAKWFIEKMNDKIGQEAVIFTFYDDFKIILGEDFKEENGKATITMTISRYGY